MKRKELVQMIIGASFTLTVMIVLFNLFLSPKTFESLSTSIQYLIIIIITTVAGILLLAIKYSDKNESEKQSKPGVEYE